MSFHCYREDNICHVCKGSGKVEDACGQTRSCHNCRKTGVVTKWDEKGLRIAEKQERGLQLLDGKSTKKPWFALLALWFLLPSCVEFQANGGATAAHYKGPPWGKVAYAKGDEMFTTDHDAGFIALVTAVQNLLSQLGLAVIAGDVVKVQQLTQQLLNKGVSQQVIAQTTANASAAASAAKLAATKAGIAGGAPLAPIKITAP